MGEFARLHPDDLESIARRSAELVLAALDTASAARGAQLVDAAEVARRFGVDRGWVYAHADELGAVRLGTSRRPRLRFDPERVSAALTSRAGIGPFAAGTDARAAETSGSCATAGPSPSWPGRRWCPSAAHSRSRGVESALPTEGGTHG